MSPPPPPPPVATMPTHDPEAVDVEMHATSDTTAVQVPNPTVMAQRRKTQKFNGGVAAKSSSDDYKAPAPWKPKAKRWDDYITQEFKSRKPSSLKAAARFLAKEGLISLGGGLPSSEYFPFESISARVPAAGRFTEAETAVSGQDFTIGKHDTRTGKSAFDLAISLNYGLGAGSSQMLRWVTEHTEICHNPPYQDWQCVLNCGSTFSTEQCYRMLCDRGDYILYEEYTFASAVETAFPLGLRPIGIKMDKEGLIPEVMDEILSNWDEAARGARKPRVLYTVPSGQNPTGATMSTERRREVYAVAQKHDIIILEDEPYYFLQMQPYGDAGDAPLPSSSEEFLKALVPSLLSMDVDGRVIRFDSFSKVVAPGTRVGWVTASEQLVDRIIRHNENSIQNPSGISQVILHRLLDETWGHEGYFDWLIHIRKEYTRRRNMILKDCEKFLPREICSWEPPMAGMFLWIQIHPPADKYSISDYAELEEKIFYEAIQECVLLTPGSWFTADKTQLGGEDAKMFFRATYAAASEEQIAVAVERFGKAIRRVFELE